MLDVNRLLGIVFHSSKRTLWHELKKTLLPIAADLESDDVAVVMGEYCQGPGEIGAYIANAHRLANEADFISMTKAVAVGIGEANVNSPKIVFVITDNYSKDMMWVMRKLGSSNQTYAYKSHLYFLQVHPTQYSKSDEPLRTIVSNCEDLGAEIRRILQEVPQCCQMT